MDDGLCHICRRVPMDLDHSYAVTTCVDCDATASLHAYEWPFHLAVAVMLFGGTVQAIKLFS